MKLQLIEKVTAVREGYGDPALTMIWGKTCYLLDMLWGMLNLHCRIISLQSSVGIQDFAKRVGSAYKC